MSSKVADLPLPTSPTGAKLYADVGGEDCRLEAAQLRQLLAYVASMIPITDAGGRFDAENVEDALLEIDDSIDGVGSLVGALSTSLAATNGTVSGLSASLSTAESDIDALQSDVSAAQGAITTLGTRTTAAEGNITSLDTRTTAAEADIDALQAEVAYPAVTALTISGGVVNVNLALGTHFTLALTANVTSVTFSNLPPAGRGCSIAIQIQQDATGGRTFALPSSFKATGGSDTAVQSAANAYTLLTLINFGSSTRWTYAMQEVAA